MKKIALSSIFGFIFVSDEKSTTKFLENSIEKEKVRGAAQVLTKNNETESRGIENKPFKKLEFLDYVQ